MKTIALFAISLSLLLLAGCGSNIKHIAGDAKSDRHQVFNAPLDRVWSAAQSALAEDDTFKVLDKASGIIVTEFRAVEGEEMSLFKTAFFGKTYKYSYTLNFVPAGNGATGVKINVKLQAAQFWLVNREEKLENVENYLRQKLFAKIAENVGASS